MTEEQIEVAAKKFQELMSKHNEIISNSDAISHIVNYTLTYEFESIIYALTENKP